MQAGEIVTLFFTILVSCSGIFLNILVTFSSFRAWHKDKFQSSQNLIVFFTGLSCIMFSSFQFFTEVSLHIWTSVFQSLNLCLIGINSIYIFNIFFILSMTAWLSIFYCVKIVSFHHRLLIAIKSRFLANLPRLIAGTFVISSILLILLNLVIFTSIPIEHEDNNSTYCHKVNDSLNGEVLFINNIFKLFNLFLVGPFLLVLLSLGCTVTSLVRHVCRIQLSPSLGNSNVKAHMNAAKIITLLLLLNVSFYLSYAILSLKLVILSDFGTYIFGIIYYSFWPLQALTLLFRNPKSSPFAFICFCRSRSHIT